MKIIRSCRSFFKAGRSASLRLHIVSVDAAGQTVKFVVTIAGVRPATLDELVEGLLADGGSGIRMH